MVPNDYANPREGDWSEYARLVLAELERHNQLLAKMDEKLDGLKLQQAIYDREIATLKAEIVELKAQVQVMNNRLIPLENTDLTDKAIKKYRKWIIGAVFAMLTSVALPLIDLVLKLTESGGN